MDKLVPVFADSLPTLPIFLTAILAWISWVASPFLGLASLVLLRIKRMNNWKVVPQVAVTALILLPYLLVYGFNLEFESLVSKLGGESDFFTFSGAKVAVFLLAIGQFRYLLRKPATP